MKWPSNSARLRNKLVNPHQLHRVVDGAEHGRAEAAAGLASLLLAISQSGDAGLIADTERVVMAAKPQMWLSMDISARRSMWYAPNWTKDVAHRLRTGHTGPLDLLLAACHPDGFIREAAVAAIAERQDVQGAVPTLALRAADWVPEVRDRARQACQWYIDHAPADAVALLAPVALALQARQAGGWLVDAVDRLLREGPPEALSIGVDAGDWRTRRTAYTAAVQTNRLNFWRMQWAAMKDPDLPIRIMCAEAAIRTAQGNGDHDVPRRLLTSGTAMVRAEAVHAMGVLGDVGPAFHALSDRSALVRSTAQTVVRRAGTDPATRYRELLAFLSPNPSVIAGLGETGTHADADLLQPWLAHPTSRGRAEAVRALRRLGRTSPDLLLPLLTDTTSSVTRQVVLSLRPNASTLDEQSLLPLLGTAHPRHVRQAAHRLLRARDTWTRLSADLRLVNDPEHVIRTEARADIATWLARDAATTYAFPQGPRADELAALLAAAENVLGAEQARHVRFHLRLTAP